MQATDEAVPGDLARLVGPLLPGDAERAHARRDLAGHDVHDRPRRPSSPRDLLGRDRAAAHDEHPPARDAAGSPGTRGRRPAWRAQSGDVGQAAGAARGVALLVEAQDLQLDGEVDLAERDAPSGTESTVGAKLRIDVTPAATRRSATSCARGGGRGDDADGDRARSRRSRAGRRCGATVSRARCRADLRRVDVDEGGDREAPVAEAAVVGEGLAEVAERRR